MSMGHSARSQLLWALLASKRQGRMDKYSGRLQGNYLELSTPEIAGLFIH